MNTEPSKGKYSTIHESMRHALIISCVGEHINHKRLMAYKGITYPFDPDTDT